MQSTTPDRNRETCRGGCGQRTTIPELIVRKTIPVPFRRCYFRSKCCKISILIPKWLPITACNCIYSFVKWRWPASQPCGSDLRLFHFKSLSKEVWLWWKVIPRVFYKVIGITFSHRNSNDIFAKVSSCNRIRLLARYRRTRTDWRLFFSVSAVELITGTSSGTFVSIWFGSSQNMDRVDWVQARAQPFILKSIEFNIKLFDSQSVRIDTGPTARNVFAQVHCPGHRFN